MTVTVYTHSLCPFSKQVEDYLRANTILFTAIELDHQPDKLEEFKAINGGFNGVPFTVITKDDGSQATVRGFNETELALHLLGKQDQKATEGAQMPQPTVATAAAIQQNVQAANQEQSQPPVPTDVAQTQGTLPNQADQPQAQMAAPYTPLDNQAQMPNVAPISQQMSPLDSTNQPQPQEPVQTFAADGSLMQPAQIVT